MSQDLCKVAVVRLSNEMLKKLPDKERSRIIRRALAHYFKARDERIKIPVPTNKELNAILDMCNQLRYIGHNLNQLCYLLHLVGEGRGNAPTDWEVRELHKEIAEVGGKAQTIVGFWMTR